EIADGQRRLRLLAQQVTFSFCGWKWPREVLQSCEVIDANIFRDGSILFSVGSGVDQRCGASPIFVGSVGEEYLGHHMIGDGAVEQSCFLPSQRITFRLVGKRK